MSEACMLPLQLGYSHNLYTLPSLLQVSLARHYRAPIRLPENVTVDVVIVQKKDGILVHRVVQVNFIL